MTFKDENMKIGHDIPIGALVEENDSGIRMFVAAHRRDCDGTPLYSLSAYQDSETQNRYTMFHGFPYYGLSVA